MRNLSTISTMLLLTILLMFGGSIFAKDYRFHPLTTRNGLTNNSVNSLLVDSRGFLWVGTELGLNRYDGYTMRNFYNLNGHREHPVMNVVGLQEDALGNLWVENDGSIVRYDYHTNLFDLDYTAYLKSLGFKMSDDFLLRTDTGGSLWIVTNGMIQYKNLKHQTNNDVKAWKANISLKSAREWNIEESNGDLFITDGTKLWRFNGRNGRLQHVLLPHELDSDVGHLDIYVDSDGVLWVYSLISEHICFKTKDDLLPATMFPLPYSPATNGEQPNGSASNAIRKLFDDGQGQIWIATDHAGVYVYNKQERQFVHLHHDASDATSISSDNVTTIVSDNHGTIWMGHLNTGISYCNPRYNLFSHYGSMFGDISTMLYDSHGNLWLGTDGRGLFVRYTDGQYEKTSLPNITISSLLEDHSGTMWVGSYNNGLYRMKGTRQYDVFTKENGHLPHNSVWQMTEDRKGNIWYTSVFEHVACFNIATERASEYIHEKEPISGMSFANDGKGVIYCATYYGVWVYDSNTGKARFCFGNNSGTQKFLQFYIGPMCYDTQSSMLWIGHKTGISVWDQKRDSIYYIDSTNGLLDANVKAIVRDQQGNMWVSTDRGVSCIKTISSASASGNKKNQTDNTADISFSIRNFTTNEGLQTEYFNAYASAFDRNGDVLFGGRGGYTSISPRQMMSASERPAVTFTDIFIGDSVLAMQDGKEWDEATAKLHYDDHLIRINFFTGNLVSANRVIYAYRLEGLSDKWVYSEDNHVSFFSLAPGNYTLEVKVSGEDGEWGEVSRLSISVAPPFYLSAWMLCVYAVLCLLALYLAWHFMRKRQIRKMEEEKQRIEQGQQVQLSEMKLRFFTNISHDLRTPLTLIISPLQSIMKEPLADDVRKRLAVINKNAQLLLSQVNSLLDFRRLDVGAENLKLQSIDIVHFVSDACLSFRDYADERGIKLTYEPAVSQLFMDVDAEKINKIMYNLLSNAFKFTPDGGSITVSLKNSGKRIALSVADSGVGISDADKQLVFQRFYQVKSNDPKAGSGIGLHIVSEYVRMHKGEVKVTDNTPNGAVFTVYIPVSTSSSKPVTPVVSPASDVNETVAVQAKPAEKNEGEGAFSVLVVDDNQDMCNFIADSLRDTYEIHVAGDGEEALRQLGLHDISLVVSDVMMPKIDGLELCRRIKTDIKFSHIPVILLTAKSADVSVIEGLQQGADDYITKPFNIEHLRLRIQKFIEWTNASHQTFQQRVEVEPSEITITSLDEEFVKNAIALVEANLTNSDFTVDALGRELGMSRTNLYKKLSTITGKGPHEFIRTLRMKRAYSLLEKSQMQISEIAYAVGYSSPKRFTENFKAEYGIPPSEFIKSKRG